MIYFFFVNKHVQLSPLIVVLDLGEATLCWVVIWLVRNLQVTLWSELGKVKTYISNHWNLKFIKLLPNLQFQMGAKIIEEDCRLVVCILDVELIQVLIELGVVNRLGVYTVVLDPIRLRDGKDEGKDWLVDRDLWNSMRLF